MEIYKWIVEPNSINLPQQRRTASRAYLIDGDTFGGISSSILLARLVTLERKQVRHRLEGVCNQGWYAF